MTLQLSDIEVGDEIEIVQTRNMAYLTEGQKYKVNYVDTAFISVLADDGRNTRLCQQHLPYIKLISKMTISMIKVGDYVALREDSLTDIPESLRTRKNMFDPLKVTAVGETTFMFEGFGSRRYAKTRFNWVDIKTYKAPEVRVPKFKVGDRVILNEAYIKTLTPAISQMISQDYNLGNCELIVTGVCGLSASYGSFTVPNTSENRKPNRPKYSIRSVGGGHVPAYYYIEELFEPMPEGWKPKEIKIDLNLVSAAQVGLTTHGFHTCCGAKILYSFYGLGSELRAGNAPFTGKVKVTEEIFSAAVKNTLRDYFQGTGVVLAVLATAQIEQYEDILLEAGFIKLHDNYPNLNHGSTHMNALYGYFVHEQKQLKKKETKRAFG